MSICKIKKSKPGKSNPGKKILTYSCIPENTVISTFPSVTEKA